MASPKSCKKTVEISPLAGPLNTRSTPKEVPFGVWRWRQNVWVDPSHKVCRRPGWRKFLDRDDYNNQDLHDQGQVTGTNRETITYVQEAVSTGGTRRLIAGTNNKLFISEFSTGTWNQIYERPKDRHMTKPTVWATAPVNDGVVFSDNVYPLFVWFFDAPSTSEIASLTTIGLSRAAVLYSWKGVIFLGDVTMDGERVPHRVVWGDLNTPLNFEPSASSISGFQDLSYGERVLSFHELGDYLLIYTTLGVWQVTAIGGDAVFNFRAAYQALETSEACLAYPNTLASTGQSHLFLGSDGLYEFDLFKAKPERLEWMHAATNIIFDTIDDECCTEHNAAYFPPSKEYLISWCEKGSNRMPLRTLAFNLSAQNCDVIDHGFTAMLTHIPDMRPSVRQAVGKEFPPVVENGVTKCPGGCICGEDEFNAIMQRQYEELYPDQPPPPPPVGTCQDEPWDCPPTYLTGFTRKTKTLDDGKIVEDPEGPANGDLCCFLNANIDIANCIECATKPRLILVSAFDNTLKEFGEVYYRERYKEEREKEDARGCQPDAYAHDSYQTILLLGPMNFDLPDELKTLTRVELEFYTALSGSDLKMTLSVATSDYAAEPLEPYANIPIADCPMVYRVLAPKKLVCESVGRVITKPAAPPSLTPDTKQMGRATANWTVWFQARYLTLKMVVDGNTDKDYGGPLCLPVLRMEVFSNRRWPDAKE